jgi:hypothetical protein
MYLPTKTIPYKLKDKFRICECDRCGEPLIAYERDAKELAAIFSWHIQRENMWITKLKRRIISTLQD